MSEPSVAMTADSLVGFTVALKAVIDDPVQHKRLQDALDSTRDLPPDLRYEAIKSKLAIN